MKPLLLLFILIQTLAAGEAFCDPKNDEIREITDPIEITKIKTSIKLDSYSVKDVPLVDALKVLTKHSLALSERLGYKAVEFVVGGSSEVARTRVTLTTKNSTMKMICLVLAEQASAKVVYSKSKVTFEALAHDLIEEEKK